MREIQVYNTLGHVKQPFEALHAPRVGMYVCGPTVYGHPHLGHAKSYVSFDVILRWLRRSGYHVTYIQNITDVGHLTDDQAGMADEGEDKVAAEARRKRIHPMALAEFFTASYFEDMDAMGLARPDVSPRASGHIPEQIEMVEGLLEKGHAYNVDGNVYFDVSSFPTYGALSGRNVEDLAAGARVEVREEKRHPADFAIWKKAAAEHIMQWSSPWGRGYPGWHLECSVMSRKYLSDTLDIHGGGIENQFPHHECEIAQSEAVTGKPFVRYWLHNNMVTVDGQKMGKSLGNFITLKHLFSGDHERISRAYEPQAVRMFVLTSHYRSPLDFSDSALQAARSGYEKLSAAVIAVRESLAGAPEGEPTPEIRRAVEQVRTKFTDAMNDDFNTAAGLAQVFELTGKVALATTRGDFQLMDETFRDLGGRGLGLVQEEYPTRSGGREAELIDLLIDLRRRARQTKDFTTSDAIRDRLKAIGFQLEDTPEATTWRRMS